MTLKQDDPYKRKEIQMKKNPLKNMTSKPTDEEELKGDENFRLPLQKGLRTRIFTEVLKYLPANDTLHCALVSREWLSISRSEEVWKSHFGRDLLYKVQDDLSVASYDEKLPCFLQYFRFLDHLLANQSLKHKPKIRYRKV